MNICTSLSPLKGKGSQNHAASSIRRKICLQVTTELKALSQVLQWFDQLHPLQIPQTAWMQCQLALAEAFTNAVRHAHKGLPSETPIQLEVTVFNEHLEIKLWDYGKPFDLEAMFKNLKDLDQDYWFSATGSRGIMLMKRISDYLSYKRTADNRNCLVMVKYFKA